MKTYKYLNPEQTIVAVIDEDGISRMSGLASVLVPEDEMVLPYEPPPTVRVVSPRQIRQALTQAGLREQVEIAVAAGSSDLRDWWQYATQFEQNHPLILAMATELGQTEQQVADLFTLAASL